jgi:hypothetical protein
MVFSHLTLYPSDLTKMTVWNGVLRAITLALEMTDVSTSEVTKLALIVAPLIQHSRGDIAPSYIGD